MMAGRAPQAAADLVGTLTALLKEKEAMATEMVSSSIKQMMEGETGINPIVTLEKQLLNMIENLA